MIPERFQREEYGRKIIIERLPNWLTLRSTPLAPSFINKLAAVESDLLHFHFPYPFGETAWLFAGRKLPYVVTYHSDIGPAKILRRFSGRSCTGSFRVRKKFLPRLSLLSNRLRFYRDTRIKFKIVPLGIDPERLP